MKATQGRIGRIFLLRLENDDIIPTCIEKFAQDNLISCAHVVLIGGVYKGDVVVGPRKTEQSHARKGFITFGRSP